MKNQKPSNEKREARNEKPATSNEKRETSNEQRDTRNEIYIFKEKGTNASYLANMRMQTTNFLGAAIQYKPSELETMQHIYNNTPDIKARFNIVLVKFYYQIVK
jgi:hypothetical protein